LVFSIFRFDREHAVTDTLDRDRLLSVEESAAFVNVCQVTVRREVARGRLRGQKVGARWRFAPEDLRAYLSRTGGDDYAELVREIVAAAPPPTPEQLQRLTALFDYRPARD